MMIEKETKDLSASILKEVKIFSAFSDADLEYLTQKGSYLSCEAYTNIIVEGEMSWGLYLILSGKVQILKTDKLTGVISDIGSYTKGHFFGEMSLIDEHPRSATIRSLSNCDLFFISKDEFLNFLNQDTKLAINFYKNCIQNLIYRLRELGDNYVITQYQLWRTAIKKE